MNLSCQFNGSVMVSSPVLSLFFLCQMPIAVSPHPASTALALTKAQKFRMLGKTLFPNNSIACMTSAWVVPEC